MIAYLAPRIGPSIVSTTETAKSLTIRWEELSQDDQNGVILGYRVTVVAVNTNELIAIANVTERNFTQGGLNEYTNYSVSVAAFTSVGIGNSSVAVIETREAGNNFDMYNVAM